MEANTLNFEKLTDEQGFEVELPPRYTYENSLKFESEEVENFFKVDGGNTVCTQEMANF